MGLKFVDLFCGIGTIRMGMEQAAHECVYSVEWDKHKRKIYSIIFGKEPEGADIRTINARDIPRADVWTFGAPCQDFSIAGKRLGMDGERSSLVLEVFRLVRETKEEDRPKYLIYENVKGMLSSNGGRDFLGILGEMASLGYDFIEYSLLNSKNFGVPQNRERVFTIGHFRGQCSIKIFPLTRQSNPHTTIGKSTETAVARTLTAGGHSGGNHSGMTIIQVGKLNSSQDGIVIDPMGISKTLTSGHYNTPKIISKTVRSGGRCSPPNAKQNWDTYEVDGRIRRLTPKECWRLQGIADVITDKVIQAGISDSQMYRGAGDACSVPVICEIGKKLT